MSSTSRETFKALGPVEWEAFAQDDPTIRMPDIFNDAHCLIDSIPSPSDDNSIPTQPAEYLQRSKELRKEWKEVRINPRDNPFGLNVYKMAAKDGRGAWFARRSIHTGQSFTKWKTGIEREFSESLKVQGQPGDGKIRGLGADKCVVDKTVDGCGKMQVYQLSAQFPGPTTPRDFVTLCLSSDTATIPATKKPNQPREYILVSKPCVHTECPERSGFIRGYYESVELIREVKAEGLLQNTPSSTSAASDDPPSITNHSNDISEDSTTSNAQLDGQSDESKSSKGGDREESISTIEWIMVTRSDPGGSVPRFIIEKKTPEGIVTDAGKFVQWVSSDEFETLLNNNFESTPTKAENPPGGITSEGLSSITQAPLAAAGSAVPLRTAVTAQQENLQSARSPGPSGVYGMISSALSMVASAAASRLYGPPRESESETSTPDLSDTSSLHSFHSFDDAVDAESVTKTTGERDELAVSISGSADAGGEGSVHSTQSTQQYDKELKKLEERRRKAEEKLRRAEERALAKKNDDAQRDELALAKLREKHEREMAKQEEKYQKERRKLEAKRAAEEKKAEARRRKQLEREDKANMTLELERTRAERDVARKEIEIWKEQVGQLQALNTRLVARLGREGISLEDGSSSNSLTPNSASASASRGATTPGSVSASVDELDRERMDVVGRERKETL